MQASRITITSPAKVNLYLHVTGKRDDGYHLLDSMVAFVRHIDDRITIEPSADFCFQATGPFATGLTGKDLSAETDSSNLVVRAARAFSALSGIDLTVSITLEKNIPMGAGLGGGSGDAAATFKGLEEFFGVAVPMEKRDAALLQLGADVPVCYAGETCRFQGIGELITPCPPLHPLHILLVWPNKPSMTKDVFSRMTPADYTPAANIPPTLNELNEVMDFLQSTGNSLTRTAIETCPDIAESLKILAAQKGCHLPRMSGSGSCIFGLFDNDHDCRTALEKIKSTHPSWWVKSGQI